MLLPDIDGRGAVERNAGQAATAARKGEPNGKTARTKAPALTAASASSRRPFSRGVAHRQRLRERGELLRRQMLFVHVVIDAAQPRRELAQRRGVLPREMSVDVLPGARAADAEDQHLADGARQLGKTGVRHGVAIADHEQRGAAGLPRLARAPRIP